MQQQVPQQWQKSLASDFSEWAMCCGGYLAECKVEQGHTRLKHLCCGICEDDGNLEIQVLALYISEGNFSTVQPLLFKTKLWSFPSCIQIRFQLNFVFGECQGYKGPSVVTFKY